MRVLLVGHRYPPFSRGGVERCIQLLAGELARGGDSVAVVARQPSLPQRTPARLTETDAGLTVHRLDGGDAGQRNFLAYHEPIEQLFAAVLAEQRPAVVHFHHLKDLSPRLPALARAAGAAIVYTLHDFYLACPLVHLRTVGGADCAGPDDGRRCARLCFAGEGPAADRWSLRTRYFQQLLATADRVICPSAYLADYFLNHGLDPDRLRVIANGVVAGVPPPAWLPLAVSARSTDRLHLAYLGSVVEYKGVHIILEALRQARLGPVTLDLIGQVMSPEYVRRLRRMARVVPGLTLRLYGPYELDELAYLLNGIDAVIIPSLVAESFSLTAREALLHRVPVLAAQIGALPEVIQDGHNGLTYSPRRPAALAAHLRRLAAESGLRQRLRDGASQSRVLTLTEHTRQVRAVYSEALVAAGTAPAERAAREATLTTLFAALLERGFAAQP